MLKVKVMVLNRRQGCGRSGRIVENVSLVWEMKVKHLQKISCLSEEGGF